MNLRTLLSMAGALAVATADIQPGVKRPKGGPALGPGKRRSYRHSRAQKNPNRKTTSGFAKGERRRNRQRWAKRTVKS